MSEFKKRLRCQFAVQPATAIDMCAYQRHPSSGRIHSHRLSISIMILSLRPGQQQASTSAVPCSLRFGSFRSIGTWAVPLVCACAVCIVCRDQCTYTETRTSIRNFAARRATIFVRLFQWLDRLWFEGEEAGLDQREMRCSNTLFNEVAKGGSDARDPS